MIVFFWVFLAITAVFWLYSWGLFAKFRTVPKSASADHESLPKISIIIPARDEEGNLKKLLPSLTNQSFAAHEIIVVNDNSSDATAAVAEENGAIVIDGKPLPKGWFGKPWACTQGSERATGEWLLFLDADTQLEPDGLKRIARLSSQPKTVHAICPHHEIEDLYEELSAFFNVIMVLGMNAFSIRGSRAKNIGLFGQCLFIQKSDYKSVGGHSSVKRVILENFGFARHCAAAGLQNHCYLGRGTITMRMFPDGLSSLISSWGKGCVSGSKNTPSIALFSISIWISAMIMSMISLTFLPLATESVRWAIGILYLACALQCLFVFKKVGNFSFLSALLFPIGQIFYQVLFFKSVRRGKTGGQIEWKGRNVGS